MNYKFKCKQCGCEVIDEVLLGATVYSQITSIKVDNDELILEYGKCIHDHTSDYDFSIRYECNECGTEVSLEQMKAISGT